MSTEKLPEKRKKREFLKVILLLIFVLAMLETLSFLAIRIFFPEYKAYPYNRIVSGSTIYYNTPGYNYKTATIKVLDTESDLIIDSNGFVCNHPVTREKPEGVIRIFLMGGSAMFGSGQSKPYNQIKDYPSGNYSWESSMAGCLKRALDSICPERNFEVINASCSGFTTRQSMFLYLERVHWFSPDYIVEMDGMNDLGSIIIGDEVDLHENTFKSYFNLAARNQNLFDVNMIKLIQLIQNQMLDRKSEKLSQAVMSTKLNFDPTFYTQSQYDKILPSLNSHSGEYLKTIERFEATLAADSVKFVYVLQPLLYRRLINKKLSPSETQFVQRVDPITMDENDINRFHLKDYQTEDLSMYAQIHLMLFYYFDLVYAASLEASLLKYNNLYIDGNYAIRDLGGDFEFFTDYCHMTSGANKYMAEVIAQELLMQITTIDSISKTEVLPE